MDDDPVFIAGLERTGTSLMYALLASHEHISMTRRTNFWRYFADQFGNLEDDENLDRCLAKLRVYKRMAPLELDFAQLRADFVTGPRSYGRLYGELQRQVADRRGKPRWGDKSLNIERHTERLLEEYPNARVLHMMRDPRDRLASVMSRWTRRKGAVAVGTAGWLWSSRLARQNVARYPDRYRIVRYESLVRDPEAELREICDFIGEPYDEQMLTMSGASRFRDAGSNSSYGPRTAGSITTDSIRKYEAVLSPRQIAYVQKVARSEMIEHGYEAHPVSLTTGDRLRLVLGEQPINSGTIAAWRVREAVRQRRGTELPDYRIIKEPV
jgi:hypothetical protein